MLCCVFLVRFSGGVLQKERTSERVVECIEGYKGKEIIRDPQYQLHINKM